jgi:hypothetical protein
MSPLLGAATRGCEVLQQLRNAARHRLRHLLLGTAAWREVLQRVRYAEGWGATGDR